jgi:glycosyltransferase involved in cell wall biosynthesis
VTDPLRVLVGTSDYPSQDRPHVRTFVGALVNEWLRQHVDVAVVAPRPLWQGAPVEQGDRPPVLRPPFVSLSNREIPGLGSTLRLTVASFSRALARAARALPFEADVAYAHFLFPAGDGILRVARERGIPAVVALGESALAYYDTHLGRARVAATVAAFDGILSVSQENRDWCVNELGARPERIRVVPNAVDTHRFHPLDRAAARLALGLPADRPIVVFAGHWNERKGPLRVLEAMRGVPEAGVVFLGEGAERPSGPQVLFAGSVAHEQVPQWLSAGDVFALPTRAEGSSNAVLEAMACGLPVVSSDIPALREAVDDRCAILVAPDDVSALSAALATMLGDPARRAAASRAALARATRVTLADRAATIAAWLRELADASRANPRHPA